MLRKRGNTISNNPTN